MINSCTIAGRLTADPKSEDFGGRKKYTASIAYNKKYTKSDGEEVEEVHFFNLEGWNVPGFQYCGKGDMVVVNGQMAQNRWEDKESGEDRQRVYLQVQTLVVPSKPKESSNGQDERPAARTAAAATSKGSSGKGSGKSKPRPTAGEDFNW